MLDAGEDGIDYLWSTGENTRYILVDSSGTGYGNVKISVEVLNEYGCKKTDEINIDFVDCTSVPEVSIDHFQIYPNPSAGVFTIKSSFFESYNEITMLSSTGKVVYHMNYSGNTSHTDHIIEVPDLESGQYTLIIKTNSRSFNISHIIIK